MGLNRTSAQSGSSSDAEYDIETHGNQQCQR